MLNCDLRKHGLTQDGDLTFLNSAALAAVLDSLQTPTAYVLGHSLGSVAALALAYPGRVRRLVLAAPGLIGFELARDSALARGARRQEAARQCHDTLSYAESFVRVWVDGPHRQPAKRRPPCGAGPSRLFAKTSLCHSAPLGHPPAVQRGAYPTPAPARTDGSHPSAAVELDGRCLRRRPCAPVREGRTRFEQGGVAALGEGP